VKLTNTLHIVPRLNEAIPSRPCMLHGAGCIKLRDNFLPRPTTGVLDLGVHLALFFISVGSERR
jgi:hypothetical protein